MAALIRGNRLLPTFWYKFFPESENRVLLASGNPGRRQGQRLSCDGRRLLRISDALVDLTPALPADRAHDGPALVRREEGRADFAPFDAVRGVLVFDVGF